MSTSSIRGLRQLAFMTVSLYGGAVKGLLGRSESARLGGPYADSTFFVRCLTAIGRRGRSHYFASRGNEPSCSQAADVWSGLGAPPYRSLISRSRPVLACSMARTT